MKNSQDERFMQAALEEALKAQSLGEVPVGAVVVAGAEVLARGHNRPISDLDPTAHAEIMAIREACRAEKNYRLQGCDLYVTLEPCAMCLGAAVQARIRRLVFGARDPKSGAVESVFVLPVSRLNHRIEIRGGILAEECGQMLASFFETRRGR
ncbi:MAG: tRNA adenosine(34) deaminase TadA [Candidatus Aminicenantales bacterium]